MNVLAKTQKKIFRKIKKGILGQFWTIFGPITQPKAIFLKKSFKGTMMAITILFGGNLWKMSQQIGVNLDKTAILG